MIRAKRLVWEDEEDKRLRTAATTSALGSFFRYAVHRSSVGVLRTGMDGECYALVVLERTNEYGDRFDALYIGKFFSTDAAKAACQAHADALAREIAEVDQ